MTDTLGYYYPRLRLSAAQAPEQLLGDSVLRAMATIARDTGALRRDITPVAFIDGTATYAVAIDGFKIIDYTEVYFIDDSTATTRSEDDEWPLDRTTSKDMVIKLQDDDIATRPEVWAHSTAAPGSISVYPFNINPALANAQLQATAQVVPQRLAAQGMNIDPDTAHWGSDSFFDIAEEMIFNLALAYTLDYPNKAFSNRTYAVELKRQVSFAIAEMKSLADDDMRSGTPRAVKYGGY